ncbi:MAG: hypothetical protein CMJ58_14670 [Planctomycetaceae bacterium]|nr:hypothetical protein [Planctomycetaceae bacterium]
MSEVLPLHITAPDRGDVDPQKDFGVRPGVRLLGSLARLTVLTAIAAVATALVADSRGHDETTTSQLEMTQRDGDTRDLPFDADQFFVPRWRLTNGPRVRSAFRDVIADTIPSTVRVQTGNRDQALGMVVGARGWILTKGSVLSGDDLACRLADGRELPATVEGVDKLHDVALLHVDADDLVPVSLNTSTPLVGSWVATVGLWRDPVAVGVVSVPVRALPHQAGVLGVELQQAREAVITRVFPDTGAAEAGLLVNDKIISVNGDAIENRVDLIRTVRSYSPGDEIELKVLRDGETITLSALLMSESSALPFSNRRSMQNMMGGALSERRFGFPRALQHDTVLRPNECGGPLVDLNGEVIGLNIARSGRTESYAIDAATVADVATRLMTAAGAEPPMAPAEPMVTGAQSVE